MVMKHNKIIISILVFALIVTFLALGVFYLINGLADTLPIDEGEELTLTEEQYRLLKSSILSAELDEMCEIMRLNSWLFLNAMKEKNFIENTFPGESGVGLAVYILYLLGVGKIEEFTVVRVEECTDGLEDLLVVRIVNENKKVYYVMYGQTWGLGSVIKERENGKIIYSPLAHFLWDGKIHVREGFDDLLRGDKE